MGRLIRSTGGLTSVEYILVIGLLAVMAALAWRTLGEGVAEKGREAERTLAGLPTDGQLGSGGANSGSSTGPAPGGSPPANSAGGLSTARTDSSGAVGGSSSAVEGGGSSGGGSPGSLGDADLGSLLGDADLGGSFDESRTRRSGASTGRSSDPRDRWATMDLDEVVAPARPPPEPDGIRVASSDGDSAFGLLAGAQRREAELGRREAELGDGVRSEDRSELTGGQLGEDAANSEPGSWESRFTGAVREGFVDRASEASAMLGEAWDYATTPSRWSDTASALAPDRRRLRTDPVGYLWQGVKDDVRVAKDVWIGVGREVYDTGADLVSGDPERMGRRIGSLGFDGAIAAATGGATAGVRRLSQHLRGHQGAHSAAAVPRPPTTPWGSLRLTGDFEGIANRLQDLERRGVTGNDPLLFRGAETQPSLAFKDGLAVRPHPESYQPFAEFYRDGPPPRDRRGELRAGNVYASTTSAPRVARRFAIGKKVRDRPQIYVLRGQDAKKLYPEYKRSHESEHEWAMREIRPEHIVGVLERGDRSHDMWHFRPNPGYGGAEPNAGRGRLASELLSERRDVVRQPSNDLEELYAQAARSQPEFEDAVRTAADVTGGEAVTPGLKSIESARDKLATTSPSRIKDISRARIVYDSVDDVYRGLDDFIQHHEVLNLKDRFARPSPDGYRDIQFNIRTSDGHIHEVQLHHRGVLDETESGGHRAYEDVRGIQRAAQREDRALTATEREAIERIQAERRARYEQALSEE